jgi:hypothetical protein
VFSCGGTHTSPAFQEHQRTISVAALQALAAHSEDLCLEVFTAMSPQARLQLPTAELSSWIRLKQGPCLDFQVPLYKKDLLHIANALSVGDCSAVEEFVCVLRDGSDASTDQRYFAGNHSPPHMPRLVSYSATRFGTPVPRGVLNALKAVLVKLSNLRKLHVRGCALHPDQRNHFLGFLTPVQSTLQELSLQSVLSKHKDWSPAAVRDFVDLLLVVCGRLTTLRLMGSDFADYVSTDSRVVAASLSFGPGPRA